MWDGMPPPPPPPPGDHQQDLCEAVYKMIA